MLVLSLILLNRRFFKLMFYVTHVHCYSSLAFIDACHLESIKASLRAASNDKYFCKSKKN